MIKGKTDKEHNNKEAGAVLLTTLLLLTVMAAIRIVKSWIPTVA